MTAASDAERAKAADANERGEGICRTCLAPIWNEGGTVGHQKRETGWSDRIERGGDSLVCFKAIDYRHVPLTGREAAIYDHAYALGAAERAAAARLRAVVADTGKPDTSSEEEWPSCYACGRALDESEEGRVSGLCLRCLNGSHGASR